MTHREETKVRAAIWGCCAAVNLCAELSIDPRELMRAVADMMDKDRIATKSPQPEPSSVENP